MTPTKTPTKRESERGEFVIEEKELVHLIIMIMPGKSSC